MNNKNKLRWWTGLATCLSLVLLGACASADKAPKPPVERAVVQAPGKTVLTLTEGDAGARVVLDATQELRVDLVNSGWEVANNFDWSVADLRPGVLDVLGSRFERTQRDTNPTESDGFTVWRLKSRAPGHVTLSFALRRPYSTGPAQRTVDFDVTVK